MSHSKRREENEWKIRKETPKPHGPVKPLSEYADEYDAQQLNK